MIAAWRIRRVPKWMAFHVRNSSDRSTLVFVDGGHGSFLSCFGPRQASASFRMKLQLQREREEIERAAGWESGAEGTDPLACEFVTEMIGLDF